MKPVNVKNNTYTNSVELHSSKEADKNPKFKGDDHVRISKYKKIVAKGYTSIWSEEVFAVKWVKNTVSWTYVAHKYNNLNGDEITGTFYKKNYKRKINKNLELKK